MIRCSIIICTRNRAQALEKTLQRFLRVSVPDQWDVEMIIADNGSTDTTAEVIRSASHPRIQIRRLFEEKPGKSRAQNLAINSAQSDVLLFTDDDVEPADNWIERMAVPLVEKRASAVVGRIILSKELRRSWMTPMHEMWLAAVDSPSEDNPVLIGACMGLHRSVFERVAEFDEELGPGATGFGEETLLWRQMSRAGLKILPVFDTCVVHHPDVSRLERSCWLAAAQRYGRTDAYIRHHWEHFQPMLPELQILILRCKLFLRRNFLSKGQSGPEGCPAWEISYLVRLESLLQWRIERLRPRNYERRALVRIRPQR